MACALHSAWSAMSTSALRPSRPSLTDPEGGADVVDAAAGPAPTRRGRPRGGTPTRERAKRWGIRVAVALVALWLLYFLGANAVGRSQWLQGKLSADPQAAQITFTDFWTVIPGNFHLRNLHATFQYQTGTQVEVVGDRVEIDFALFPLLAKHVVAKRLAIEGFEHRERDATGPLEGDPPIATTTPLDPTKAPPALWYDESKSGWLIRIDELAITHARELWFYPFRYRGDAALTGALRLRPNRELAFDALRFELEPGTGQLMGAPALKDLHGSIEGTMDPIDPQELRDVAVLRSLSITTSLGTELEDPSFMNRFVPKSTAIIAGPGGRVALSAKMDHGHVAAPGNAYVAVDQLWINVGGIAIETSLHANAAVRPGTEGTVTNLSATVDASLLDPKMTTLATANGTTLYATLGDVDFAKLMDTKLSWSLQLPSARLVDAADLDGVLAPYDARFLSGSVLLRGTAHGELGGAMAGHVWASSDQVTLVRGDATYTGKLSAGGDFSRAKDGADLNLAHVFLYLDDGAVARAGLSTAWWGHVDVDHARIRTKDSAFVGAAHVRLRGLEPVFAAVDQLHGIPSWIHRMADLHPWDVQIEGTFGKHVELRNLDAVAGEPGRERARVRVTFDDTVPDAEHLRAALELGALTVGVEKRGKTIDLVLVDVNGWWERSSARPPR
jgi:hypothetical protein